MVAMPVAEMVSTPGPKYSTMAPVPPLTVRIPATLRMMSIKCQLNGSVSPFYLKGADSGFTGSGERTLGRSPAAKTAGKLNTNDLGCLKLPGETSHDIDSISSTNTNGGHTKTTSVGSVRVGTDHKTTGESVVLEDDLVNNTGARLPETDVVLGTRGAEEVVYLLVDVVEGVATLGMPALMNWRRAI
jgi:hypothetical protein